MTFDLHLFRFHFSAQEPIAFPPGLPGNILRGALGSVFRRIACGAECPGRAGKNIRECAQRSACAYAQIFEPASLERGPSGLEERPRPFVIRAAGLSGTTLPAGQPFCFDVHLFDTRHPPAGQFTQAFAQLAAEGLGPSRGRAELRDVEQSMISVPLDSGRENVSRIRVEFRTPAELKTGSEIAAQPDFAVLLARARDRVSTLRALYGAGPLDIDFRALGRRAQAVRTVRSEVRHVQLERRSSRTRQRHGIGGLIGFAEYEGQLGEFLPYLEAARWTGVGRHCVWGNGEIATEVL